MKKTKGIKKDKNEYDITERAKAEVEELSVMEEDKREFFADEEPGEGYTVIRRMDFHRD